MVDILRVADNGKIILGLAIVNIAIVLVFIPIRIIHQEQPMIKHRAWIVSSISMLLFCTEELIMAMKRMDNVISYNELSGLLYFESIASKKTILY